MKIEIDNSTLEDLRESAELAKEQCGIAVATASDAIGYPDTAEECLKQTASAYSYVRWLTDTINKMLKGKEV